MLSIIFELKTCVSLKSSDKVEKSLRLKDYDYSSPGAYFITICTKEKKHLFSNIVGQGLAPAEVELYPYGEIAQRELQNLEKSTSI